WIDGQELAYGPSSISVGQHVVLSDQNVGGGKLTVNWLHMGPYAASSTYVSHVFDAGSAVAWQAARWTAQTPPGTQVALAVRMGNTATPDGTWTDFIPLPASGAIVGGKSRYLQYRALLTTTDPNQTPLLQNVSFSYTSQDTVPPTVVSVSPANRTSGASPTAP